MSGSLHQLLFTAPGSTTKLTTSDTPQALPAGLLNDNNRPVKRVWITVEDNDIRIGFNITVSTTLGHLFFPGDIITLDSNTQANDFKVLSAVAGVHGIIQFTGEY